VVFPSLGSVPTGTESIGAFKVVCYSGGTKTASGERVGTNVVAVDRSVIALGTKIYIDGVGWRTALDVGSGVKGRMLDIWMPTNADCRQWGAKNREVFLVGTATPAVPVTPSAPSDQSSSVPADSPVAPSAEVVVAANTAEQSGP
jgi:3D (Asp-Asp-Asp) domain-containing protein